MSQYKDLSQDEITERIVSMWNYDGQYEGVSELDYYIDTLIEDHNMDENEALQFVTSHIDLDDMDSEYIYNIY